MESIKILYNTIETAIDGIIIIDRRGRIESLNPSVLKIFGYVEEDLLGENISILMSEPDKSRYENHLIYCQHTEKRICLEKEREVRGLKKDGSRFYFRFAVTEIQLQSRIIYTSFIHDLSKEKEAEEYLKKYTSELEEIVESRTQHLEQMLFTLEKSKEETSISLEKEKDLNRMKSRFVSMASHEFRTPLSSMQLSVVLIEKYLQISDSDQILKHLHKIRNTITCLNAILNDFLSLEKLDIGILKPYNESFDIVQFSKELTEEMQLTTKENQIIIYQHTGAYSKIHIDKNLLRNCLLNLVTNAIKYSGEHTLIDFSTEINEEEYSFTIKDNGLGIPLEDHSFIFQPFFRAHNIGDISGTGLGLNIVLRYVDLLKGEIHFESEPGVGTRFTLLFKNNNSNNTL
ncbi:PAS domain-containing sensor histidine kinase [Chryseobacterium sp. MEBOG06]|uniref:PAS domain-containing sensor histidine kinase n=1 Tax=Chryseobacterium sp. MEBOG06 TaxID=2879938 RepID=UPI001F236A52|nr:PAS domain-containing sensor histidine kinase [Chryseobacterium sp. MEBOG06]UKB86016.1 PAS domain-containing sensor histidine kinase [Chryseobacterium sp. MEBOG06]